MSLNTEDSIQIRNSPRFKVIAIARLLDLLDAAAAKEMVNELSARPELIRQSPMDALRDLLQSQKLSAEQVEQLRRFSEELSVDAAELLPRAADRAGRLASKELRMDAAQHPQPSRLQRLTAKLHQRAKVSSGGDTVVEEYPGLGELQAMGSADERPQAEPPSVSQDLGLSPNEEPATAAPLSSRPPVSPRPPVSSGASVSPGASVSSGAMGADPAHRPEERRRSRRRSGRDRRRRDYDYFDDWQESWDSRAIRILRDMPEAGFRWLASKAAWGILWSRQHPVVTTAVAALVIGLLMSPSLWRQPPAEKNSASPRAGTRAAAAPDPADFPAPDSVVREQAAAEAASGRSSSSGAIAAQSEPAQAGPAPIDAAIGAKRESGIAGGADFEVVTPADFPSEPDWSAADLEDENLLSLAEEDIGQPASRFERDAEAARRVAEQSVIAAEEALAEVKALVDQRSYRPAIAHLEQAIARQPAILAHLPEINQLPTALLLAQGDENASQVAAGQLVQTSRFDSWEWRLNFATWLMKSTPDTRIGLTSILASAPFDDESLRQRLLAWIRSRDDDSQLAAEQLSGVDAETAEAGDLLYRALAHIRLGNNQAATDDIRLLLQLIDQQGNSDSAGLPQTRTNVAGQMIRDVCGERLRKLAHSWLKRLQSE
jgi:hypothetical protein